MLSFPPCSCERIWESDGVPVLRAVIDLPCPEECRSIRTFYALQSRAYLRYCETFLLPPANKDLLLTLEESRPFTLHEASLTSKITYQEGSLLSVLLYSREDSGLVHCRGDTWDLATGAPVPLSRFLPRRRWKRFFYEAASSELERRIRSGAARCREDWQRSLRRNLSARNFYLTEEGLSFFVPMYTLGGAELGIPTFTIPWKNLRDICKTAAS